MKGSSQEDVQQLYPGIYEALIKAGTVRTWHIVNQLINWPVLTNTIIAGTLMEVHKLVMKKSIIVIPLIQFFILLSL